MRTILFNLCGHGHLDLHAVGLPAFQQDILDGERTLRPLLAERGQVPRWFRHPYLRAGRTPEERAALSAFLDINAFSSVVGGLIEVKILEAFQNPELIADRLRATGVARLARRRAPAPAA